MISCPACGHGVVFSGRPDRHDGLESRRCPCGLLMAAGHMVRFGDCPKDRPGPPMVAVHYHHGPIVWDWFCSRWVDADAHPCAPTVADAVDQVAVFRVIES